ncbi:conserved hypothetical protein [Planktothrix rubescens CCAP 1459/22]|uniref:Uncharacterized protein n=1 Tax=Planktothrix rubescens CCAP 1459/22 TaxID=329571 RepID=A0A6J7ZSK8_PLARU|nr:conserved hypothetical protein [Planktothrix rubescens NIVA-CYA 18]CAD0228346.1 conserved hypothetical protein [Planktothrix agardhii]
MPIPYCLLLYIVWLNLDNQSCYYGNSVNLGLWLRWIEQAPPEESGTIWGNPVSECGQTQGSLSLETDKVILSQAFPLNGERRCRDWL